MKKEFPSPVHVGELVSALLKHFHLSQREVYQQMNYTKGAFSALLKKGNWDTGQIAQVSKIMRLNLFAFFIETKDIQKLVEAIPQLKKDMRIQPGKIHRIKKGALTPV